MFGPSLSTTRQRSLRSRLLTRAAGLAGAVLLIAFLGGAQEKPAAPASPPPDNKPAEFVGSATCQMCHAPTATGQAKPTNWVSTTTGKVQKTPAILDLLAYLDQNADAIKTNPASVSPTVVTASWPSRPTKKISTTAKTDSIHCSRIIGIDKRITARRMLPEVKSWCCPESDWRRTSAMVERVFPF